jgi:Zn-dependent M16 (insulinase) family peptidase
MSLATSVQALFPDNTYGVDSGGDPKVIPQLTFEQFKVSLNILVLAC